MKCNIPTQNEWDVIWVDSCYANIGLAQEKLLCIYANIKPQSIIKKKKTLTSTVDPMPPPQKEGGSPIKILISK